MLGPFKNELVCSIDIMVFPSDLDDRDGYLFGCVYFSKFWGKYYTSNAESLIKRLVDMMCDYFENTSEDKIIEDEKEMVHFKFKYRRTSDQCFYQRYYG